LFPRFEQPVASESLEYTALTASPSHLAAGHRPARPTPARPEGHHPYRPDIEGLRALAVMVVILYHGYPHLLTGGFIGVDVFFVISGFLISSNIFRSLDAQSFGLLDFYSRRILRIVPALTVVLIACFAYGFLVLMPGELAQLGLHIAAGGGFVMNLLLWQEAGYFDHAAIYKPLLHLWSLGVEEQFYIFWPLALLVFSRRRNAIPAFLVISWTLSFGVSIALGGENSVADFYSPVTRLWELDSGAILAWLSLYRRGGLPGRWRAADLTSGLGLTLILGSAVSFDQSMPFPGALALLPVLGSILLLAAGPGALMNRTLLAARPAVFVGTISYPLYLWHWPLISYCYIIDRGHRLHVFLVLCLIAAAIVLAWATYRFVERPIRYGSAARRNALTLLAGVLTVSCAGIAAYSSGGFPARLGSLPDLTVAKINAAVDDGIFRPTRSMAVRKVDGITVASIGTGAGNVLFTGDSVVFQYGPRVQHLFDQGQLRHGVVFAVGPSCPPVPGIIRTGPFANCNHLQAVASAIVASQHIQTIILGANWGGYGVDYITIKRNNVTHNMASPAGITDFYANLEAAAAAYVATGKTVYLVLAPVSNPEFDPSLMVKRSAFGFAVNLDLRNGVPLSTLIGASALVNVRLTAIARRTGARTLDPLPDVCGGASCSPFFDHGDPKFADGLHLRPGFVTTHITLFDPILTR
jgi:peptidoglycan/LPS O-acetylase OafA/YrhL